MKFVPTETLKKKGLYEEVRIKCCYCDIRDTCEHRARKESYEEAGFVTRCPYTPNRPGKGKSKNKKKD